MHSIGYKNEPVRFSLTKTNIHIVNSYKYTNIGDMEEILYRIKEYCIENNYMFKRSVKSWLAEWKAHNWLYEHNIQKERTQEVDLNEDENLLARAGYTILAMMYKSH